MLFASLPFCLVRPPPLSSLLCVGNVALSEVIDVRVYVLKHAEEEGGG